MSFTSRMSQGSDFLGVKGLNQRIAGIVICVLVVVWLIPHGRGHSPQDNNREAMAHPQVVAADKDALSDTNRFKSLGLPKLPKWPPFRTPSSQGSDLLIAYAYFETDTAFENAKFFLQAGLHDSADFIVMINGDAPRLKEILPKIRNLEVIYRENTCFDMGAYGDLIKKKDLLRSHYTKFILLNGSVRGPFLPLWSNECWSTAWLSKISDTMKLQGLSMNCARQFHVQSMVIGTDKIGLESMYKDGTFDCPGDMWAAQAQEVQMASKFMKHGWDINVWLTALNGDPSYDDREHCGEKGNDDHLFKNAYFGFDVSPYESIFTKGNRNLEPMLGKLTEWHTRLNYSSYNYC